MEDSQEKTSNLTVGSEGSDAAVDSATTTGATTPGVTTPTGSVAASNVATDADAVQSELAQAEPESAEASAVAEVNTSQSTEGQTETQSDAQQEDQPTQTEETSETNLMQDDSAQDSGSDDQSGDGEVSDEAEDEPVEPPKPPSPYADQMEWFVVHAYSGFELKAKTALEERIKISPFADMFGEILVPQETVIELVRGTKKTSSKKFFPGYMLVQMVMNQDTWHIVKDSPKITGFVGDATNPVPLSAEEVAGIVERVEEGAAAPRSRMTFEQGQAVKVIDGPFSDFNGTIEEVRPEKGKVRVLISIFGRATPVELDFIQVEKI